MMHGRLFSGFGHSGLRHGGTAGLHLLGILLLVAATIVLAAGATAVVGEWAERHFRNEDTSKVAAWVTFILVFVALGWLTLRVL
ncbi:MAG: hypothetical protein ACREHF_04420 [Rhizomicrobium sp.]